MVPVNPKPERRVMPNDSRRRRNRSHDDRDGEALGACLEEGAADGRAASSAPSIGLDSAFEKRGFLAA